MGVQKAIELGSLILDPPPRRAVCSCHSLHGLRCLGPLLGGHLAAPCSLSHARGLCPLLPPWCYKATAKPCSLCLTPSTILHLLILAPFCIATRPCVFARIACLVIAAPNLSLNPTEFLRSSADSKLIIILRAKLVVSVKVCGSAGRL